MTEESRMAYLSPSKISSLEMCQRSFWYDYILKVPKPASGTFLFGRVIHGVIERSLKQVILGGSLPSWQDATDWVDPLFEEFSAEDEKSERFAGWEWNEGDSLEKARAEAVPLAKLTLEQVLPKIKPVYVEHKISTDVDDGGERIKIYGVIDVLEEDALVTDWKTANGKVSDFGRKHDTQVDFYGKWTAQYAKRDVVQFRKIFLVRGKHPSVDSEKYEIGPRERERFDEIARTAWRVIKSGGFMPNRNTWKCSKKFCGFWNLCPFGGELLKEEF